MNRSVQILFSRKNPVVFRMENGGIILSLFI